MKTAKKIMSIVLSGMLAVSGVPMSQISVSAATDDLTVTIDTGAMVTLKDTNGDSYYEISTADELYAFATVVNDNNGEINAILTADIVVNDGEMSAETDSKKVRHWTPICNGDYRYTGTFDGNNKTVSGLYFNNSEANRVGFFGYVGGTIKDTGVINSYFYGNGTVGGVVGANEYGTITNCYNTGTVGGKSVGVGGVVGASSLGKITNCYNTGAVDGENDCVGGVVGDSYYATITNCYNTGTVGGEYNCVGGVVGDNENGTITNCYNTGEVNGKNNVGGMVGANNRGAITNCYNTDTVIGEYDGVGGIVGASSFGTITNCYNISAVSGRNSIGGVVGDSYHTTISNCFNIAAVSGGNFIGGVVGAKESGAVTNCYYLDTAYTGGIGGADAEGSAEGKTAEQFSSGEVAYILQGEQEEEIWGQKISTDEFPVLGGSRVYEIENCNNENVYSNTNENLDHEWKDATCTTPQTCLVCGLTDIEALGHNWENGVCAACDKACSHDEYVNGFCTVCDFFEPMVDSNNDGYYEINNAGNLYWYAYMVNTDRIYSKDIVLTADIEVNQGYTFSTDGTVTKDGEVVTEGFRTWTNIGDYSGARAYYGKFDGKNHTISGLYSDECGSLFYWNDGEIKNLGIINSYFYDSTAVGAIASINYGTIYNCYNTGIISGSRWIGGIAGEDCGEISNCYNTGAIVPDNVSVYCGGIVGSTSGFVSKCYNAGTISLDAEKSSGTAIIGGVVGRNNGTVSKCYNTGSIRLKSKGTMYAGGIAGKNLKTITNCYSIGLLGNIDGVQSGGYMYLGGIVSDNSYSATVDNCYYLAKCFVGATGSGNVEGTQAKTAEQFANGEVAYLLGWGYGQKIGEDAHPVFDGAKVYKVNNCKNEPAYSNTNKKMDHKWENATCTTPKTCSVCGQKQGEPLEHEFENGTCTGCGKAEEIADVGGYTISLGDKISVNFYMNLSQEVLSDENAKMIFTVPDAGSEYTVEIPVSEAEMIDDYYVFTCMGAAKDMTSVIKAQLVTSDNESEVFEYSVQEYAKYILDNPDEYADEIELVKAMLNYGSYAQMYFGYNTDNLANSILDEADRALVDELDLSAYAATTSGEQEGVKFYGGLLSLKSETAIKLYFEINDDVDMNTLKFTVNGEEVDVKENGDYYEIVIADIPAHKLAEMFEIKVGELTVKYGAFSYGNTAMGTDKETLKNVVKAMYAYNETAVNYDGGNK